MVLPKETNFIARQKSSTELHSHNVLLSECQYWWVCEGRRIAWSFYLLYYCLFWSESWEEILLFTSNDFGVKTLLQSQGMKLPCLWSGTISRLWKITVVFSCMRFQDSRIRCARILWSKYALSTLFKTRWTRHGLLPLTLTDHAQMMSRVSGDSLQNYRFLSNFLLELPSPFRKRHRKYTGRTQL